MIRSITLIAALISFHTVLSQESEKNTKLEINGSLRCQFYYDTYQSLESRDGLLYFYPLKADTANSVDVNRTGKTGSSAYFSRISLKYTGEKAFGAGLTAFIEADFFGTHQNYTGHLRLRHVFVKLSWDRLSMLFGQYWHTMVDTDVIPFDHLVGSVPYFPLNRSPQVSAFYNLSDRFLLSGAIIIHSQFNVV
ncbi:MAG: hypothetical protein JXB00_18230 [Bacteroidales bacterium]|nr:hypothetical protein [Bacteroidales bacterium]